MSVIKCKIELEYALVIVGTFLLYFLPGFLLSFYLFSPGAHILYSGENRFIIWMERVTVSIGFSLVMVPLAIFFLNPVLDLGGTMADSILVVIILVAFDVALLYSKYRSKGAGS